MTFRSIARLSILSAIALAGVGAANADVFLKVPSLKGASTQRGFEGQIAVTGASMSVSSYTVPSGDGVSDVTRTTTVGPIYITKAPDRSSPRLVSNAVEGAPLGRIEITFTSPTTQAIEAKWIIEGAEVRSYSVNPDSMNGNQPLESIEIGYASMTYQYFDSDGRISGTKPATEARFDVPADQLFPTDEGCR
jgi:type VI secretion system Hcp family effector